MIPKRLDCKMCGNCCREQGSPPFTLTELADVDLPPVIVAIVQWFTEHDPDRYDHGRVCYFLSTENKCLIYDSRPIACREFELGDHDVDAACSQASKIEKQLKELQSITVMGRTVKFRFFLEQLGRTIARELRNDLWRIYDRIRRIGRR